MCCERKNTRQCFDNLELQTTVLYSDVRRDGSTGPNEPPGFATARTTTTAGVKKKKKKNAVKSSKTD